MFRFRLQRILQLRENREKEVATRLVEARGDQQAAMQKCEQLEGARDAGIRHATELQGLRPTVGQLQNLRLIVDRLNAEIEQAYRAADAAEQNVQRRMAELTTAVQDRKVLARLRERAYELWATRETQADQKSMDTVALNAYVQAKLPSGTPMPPKDD